VVLAVWFLDMLKIKYGIVLGHFIYSAQPAILIGTFESDHSLNNGDLV
jgi:hypothetical protein